LQGADPAAAVAADRSVSTAYPWLVTAILAVAYAVAFIDRQVLNLLVDPIRTSLDLSDVQISLLQGLAFIVAYSVMGMVFGRMADRHHRRNLLIAAVIIWSLCTVSCALPRHFLGFFAARAGIGAAEAALLPASWSLLADYFERERLPRAMSFFVLGPFVGGGLALIFGGLAVRALSQPGGTDWLGGIEPWRAAFICVGSPGLLVGLALLAVREPPRRVIGARDQVDFTGAQALRYFWTERGFYGGFIGGVACLVVAVYALPAWTPALLIRVHHGSLATVGVTYGIATLIAGTAGVLSGPVLAAWFARRHPETAPMRAAIVVAVLTVVLCFALARAPGFWSALLISALAAGLVNMMLPVAAATIQSATPARLRGVATAIYALVLNGIGLGLGPTAVALVSEHVLHDPARLAVALGAIVGTAALIAVPLLRVASRSTIKGCANRSL
jgi:MFS family permease